MKNDKLSKVDKASVRRSNLKAWGLLLLAGAVLCALIYFEVIILKDLTRIV